jgi:hypothetical protein
MTPYAQGVVDQSIQTLNPQKAIGGPDEGYADFLRKEAWILLDMGRLTTSDLKLFYKNLDTGSKFRVEFKDPQLNTLHIGGNFFPLKTNEVVVDYPEDEPYRFAFIFNPALFKPFRLDAVELTEPEKTITPPSEEPESPKEPEESTEPETPTGPQPGDLISLPDDGDFATQADSAVYLVGNDNKRHAFPNEMTYMSWYNGFGAVQDTDKDTLASLPLGANTTIRPGTYLVKTMTDSKVYAVEPGGVLRWIKTEVVAADLYGDNWKERVVEIPDVFFNDYTIGDPIEAAVHPTGTLGGTPNGETVYIQNGTMYTVSGMQMEDLRLSPAFKVNLTAEEMALYIDGGSLDFAESLTYPHFAHQMEPTEQ